MRTMLAFILAAATAATAAAQTVTLHSVLVAPDGTVTVTYSKDFATCAHLKLSNGTLVHAQNIFCTSGTNVVVTAASTQFNASFGVGVSVHLCHGNNGNICSSYYTIAAKTLEGVPASISLSAGGSQTFVLAAGAANALLSHLLVGTVSGTSPGIPVGSFIVPLNQDAYFDYTFANPNVFPLTNSLGTLSSGGAAVAAFTLPAGAPPSLAGLTAHHAFAAVAPGGVITLISNATPVNLLP